MPIYGILCSNQQYNADCALFKIILLSRPGIYYLPHCLMSKSYLKAELIIPHTTDVAHLPTILQLGVQEWSPKLMSVGSKINFSLHVYCLFSKYFFTISSFVSDGYPCHLATSTAVFLLVSSSSRQSTRTHPLSLSLALSLSLDCWCGKFHLCSLVIKKLLQFQMSL